MDDNLLGVATQNVPYWMCVLCAGEHPGAKSTASCSHPRQSVVRGEAVLLHRASHPLAVYAEITPAGSPDLAVQWAFSLEVLGEAVTAGFGARSRVAGAGDALFFPGLGSTAHLPVQLTGPQYLDTPESRITRTIHLQRARLTRFHEAAVRNCANATVTVAEALDAWLRDAFQSTSE